MNARGREYVLCSQQETMLACPLCGHRSELWAQGNRKAGCCTNDGGDIGDQCPLFLPPALYWKATRREAANYWNATRLQPEKRKRKREKEGWHAKVRYKTGVDYIARLNKLLESQTTTELAKQMKISRSYLVQIMSQAVPPSRSTVAFLGLEPKIIYTKKTNP